MLPQNLIKKHDGIFDATPREWMFTKKAKINISFQDIKKVPEGFVWHILSAESCGRAFISLISLSSHL